MWRASSFASGSASCSTSSSRSVTSFGATVSPASWRANTAAAASTQLSHVITGAPAGRAALARRPSASSSSEKDRERDTEASSRDVRATLSACASATAR